MTRYEARPIRFHGLQSCLGYRFKLYSVTAGGGSANLTRFEPGLKLVESSLPTPAQTDKRPGVGFLIAHEGVGADYAVLGYWDRENELPLRVAVREQPESDWRWSQGSESICVWDLQILWFERQAYVSTVLVGGDAEQYLDLVLTEAGTVWLSGEILCSVARPSPAPGR